MLAKAVLKIEFGYPNSVLAKAASFSICRLQGLSLPQCFARRYCRLVREIAALLPGRGIFILVCSFSCQGAVTAPQIIPAASLLVESLL